MAAVASGVDSTRLYAAVREFEAMGMWTAGEAAMLGVCEIEPELAKQIVGTVHDPSEDDSRIGNVFARLNYLKVNQ